MKLSHVLVTTLGTSAFCILFSWLLCIAGVQAPFITRSWICLPAAFVAALIVAWPVSRLLRMPPLMTFAGPCPGCHTRPPGWWATGSNGMKLVLLCGACGQQSELWLTRHPPRGEVATRGHTFRLRWPEFLGIWREVECAGDTTTGGPA